MFTLRQGEHSERPLKLLKNLLCPSAHFIQQLDEIALGFEAAAQFRQISRKLALSLRAAQIVAAILAMIPPEGSVGF